MNLNKIKPLQVPLRSLGHLGQKERLDLMRETNPNCKHCSKFIEKKQRAFQKYHKECAIIVKHDYSRRYSKTPKMRKYFRDYSIKYLKNLEKRKKHNEQSKNYQRKQRKAWNSLTKEQKAQVKAQAIGLKIREIWGSNLTLKKKGEL